MVYCKIVIDTNIENNFRHIRPYLGILLVGSMALGFGFIVTSAAKQLAQAIEPVASDIEGALTLVSSGTVRYGDTVSYKAAVNNLTKGTSNIYITTVCFQGETMVFQKSVTQGISVRLYDQMVSEYEWNGEDASCTAALLYRTSASDIHQVILVDSVSFDVLAR